MTGEPYAIMEAQICIEKSLIRGNIPIHSKHHGVYSVQKENTKNRNNNKSLKMNSIKKPNHEG